MPSVQHFVALEGSMTGWLDYETLLSAGDGEFPRPTIEETDLIGTLTHWPKQLFLRLEAILALKLDSCVYVRHSCA
jgi:hypothetical protein